MRERWSIRKPPPNGCGRRALSRDGDEYARTTDGNLVTASVVEGAAAYVAAEYAAAHLPNATARAATRAWNDTSGVNRLFWGPYRYGERYVRARVESPRHLSRVYASPPTTTEQVLHRLRPGTEPRLPLRVAGDLDPLTWGSPATNDTKGELYTRVLLRGTLSADRAARAASGWGNNRHLTYYSPQGAGYAWVLRWDTRADAAEFRDAFRATLREHGERADGQWRLQDAAARVVAPAPDTVVVLAGSPAFVSNVSVTADNSTVTLRPAQ